jgi:hypothetical protein
MKNVIIEIAKIQCRKMNVIDLLLEKNKIASHDIIKTASVSAERIIIIVTAVEPELIIEAETHQYIKVKRILGLIVMVTKQLVSVLVGFAELPFFYCCVNVVKNILDIMFLKFLKDLYNMIVYIIGIYVVGNGIDAHITATAKQVNKCIYMLRKALLNGVYYPVFISYIIKRCFNSHINASSKGITVL